MLTQHKISLFLLRLNGTFTTENPAAVQRELLLYMFTFNFRRIVNDKILFVFKKKKEIRRFFFLHSHISITIHVDMYFISTFYIFLYILYIFHIFFYKLKISSYQTFIIENNLISLKLN